MTASEMIILDYFIKCNKNYEITIDELTEKISLTKTTIASILDKFVALNIIHQLGYTVYVLNINWYDYFNRNRNPIWKSI